MTEKRGEALRLDFHTHGKLAKKLPFSTKYTDWLFNEAKHAGLDALCLTEHFNTWQFEDLYGYLTSIGKRDGDALILENGLAIFSGMETDIAEGGHILSIGTPETILELNGKLKSNKTPGSFLPFKELMDLFDQYPVLVGAAHPFRAGGNIPGLPEEQLKRLDFLDLNGKDVAENREFACRMTARLGERLGKPVVAGSDTHQAVQYGCICTEFQRNLRRVDEIYADMKAGTYQVIIADQAPFQVKTAGILKRALKEIHALGGDYVDILVAVENGRDEINETDAAAISQYVGAVYKSRQKNHRIYHQ